ncbi:unnamed protein product [Rhizoctonia solani]|uniref:F-box domain-containing protein n=1 Tax=Rhizoctonia solani TaxID=456999 RepID=A0A8H3AWY9_9AGAM|nr:unnamed protein product [Rhizoctonia solani]
MNLRLMHVIIGGFLSFVRLLLQFLIRARFTTVATEQLIMHDEQNPASSALKEWEESGASLAAALNQYLNLSISLGVNSLKGGTPPKVISTQIDAALESLHVTVSEQIFQATSALAHTRNHMTSALYRLPDEVLAEIFSLAIFAPLDPYDPVSMTHSLVRIHRSLHNLAGVSHMWRNLVLVRGEFWSIVPIVDPDYSPLSLRFKQATKLSLTRATHGDLHLAAIRGYGYRPIPLLRDHVSRFRTVNITAKSHYSIDSTLRPFLKLDSLPRLSKLSLRVESEGSLKPHEPLQDKDYLFPSSSKDRESFDKMIKPLSVVRICGVQIYWSQILFSKQLVELHLQDITLGDDAVMVNLLHALTSATELRQLKLISVSTFFNIEALLSPKPRSIVLPKLQDYLIQDLYNNTLSIALDAITSRTHELTLHLTRKCAQTNESGHFEPDEVGIDDLYTPLEKIAVHALLLDGNNHDPWMSPEELESLIHSMPDLQFLGMNAWAYTREYCEALQRPQSSNALSYPRIDYMYFSWARILDEQSFKRMVASHIPFLEQMTLGAAVPGGPEDIEEWVSPEDYDEMMRWLGARVDIFLQQDYSHEQPEFLPPKWQLW